ncbi:MAG: sigma-70 family RNA polymerase sigma factor [Firmicutes bacterium]|nr:sigma-70 family RNA polymerase sigma factor [Bacillota bacterium]
MTLRLEEEFIKMLKENKNDFYRTAYSYVKNEQQALDVISEATYKGLSSLSKIREEKYMKTWFYRIIINESIALNRKNKKIVYDTLILEGMSENEMDKDEIIDLYNAIDKLPDKYKAIIILKFMKQMKAKEIGDILNINVSTVKVRVKRGIDKLKLIMGGIS